jgi:adenosine deaminase
MPFLSCFVFGYRFAEDRANFSISTDDPMVTGQQLQGDYELANHWGLTEADLIRAVSNNCNTFLQFLLSG